VPSVDQRLGVEYLDGCIVPWPTTKAAAGKELPSERETRNRELTKFLKTWNALAPIIQRGAVRTLGVEQFEPWQLERIVEQPNAVAPAYNLVSVSVTEANHGVVRWCHSHAIEVLALLDISSNILAGEHESRQMSTILAETGKDVSQVTLSWALQHGLVAFPSLVIEEPGDMTNAEQYTAWRASNDKAMGQLFGLLHPFTRRPVFCSPTRIRQVVLTADQINKLDLLDSKTADLRRHIDEKVANWGTLDKGSTDKIDLDLQALDEFA